MRTSCLNVWSECDQQLHVLLLGALSEPLNHSLPTTPNLSDLLNECLPFLRMPLQGFMCTVKLGTPWRLRLGFQSQLSYTQESLSARTA